MTTQWDQKTLQQYIDNCTQEHQNLEYKAAEALEKNDKKKSEITKDVSAMANAAGGIIIYGIKEYDDQAKKHLPEKITPIERRQYPKEWLEQIINGIQPRIVGIIIHPVDLGLNEVAYVVEIPKSTTAHQAKDLRYHRRYNFEVLQMLDHEIRDVMHRHSWPDLSVHFKYESVSGNNIKPSYHLYVTIKNEGALAVKQYKLDFSFPIYDNEATRQTNIWNKENRKGVWDVVVKGTGDYAESYEISFRSKEILFPKDEIDISGLLGITYWFDTFAKIKIEEDKIKGQEKPIRWIIYADDMPRKTGEVFLSDIHQI